VSLPDRGLVAETDAPRTGFGAVLQIRGAPRLVVSAVIGRVPLGMLSLGALLLVHEYYGSFATAGLAAGALALGTAIAAPIQGTLVDQHGAAAVLRPLAIGQGLVTGAFVATAVARAPAAITLLLALVVGMLTPPVSATLRMTWINVTESGPLRDAAFALDAMTTQLLFAIGPLLTAVSVQLAGTAAAVLLAAVITFFGTLVFAGSDPIRAATEIRSRARVAAGASDAERRWVAALASKRLRLVLVAVVLMGSAAGTLEVGLTGLAVDVGTPAASGVLIGLWCLGGVSGGWFYGRRSWSAPVLSRHRVAALGVVLASLPLLAAHSMPLAVLLSWVAGLPWAPLFASQYQMVADSAPEHAMTEAFTWNVSAIIGGTAVGSALAGVLIASWGIDACFALTAVFGLAAIAWELGVRLR
jgi:MFS family permease